MATAIDRSMTLVARIRRKLAAFRGRRPAVAPLDATTMNFNASEIARDPLPHYETLRARGTVQFLARHQAWIVLGHDEVHWAFKNPELLSNQPYTDVDTVLLGADPPAHPAVRRILVPYFSREVIDELGEFAAERAASLLAGRRHLEVVGSYGQPLSEAVAARLLGFDDTAVDAIRTSALSAMSGGGFQQYLSDIDAVAHRATMFQRLRGDGFDDAAARSLIHLFWVASTATTERVIAECVLALLEHPQARAAIETNPDLLPAFIEEVMRLRPPETMIRRRTTSGVEIGGAHIPAGADVYLCLAAANRDPRRYAQPSELRLDRDEARPMIFGYGIHRCIGATLSRATVTKAVQTLLACEPRFGAAQAPGSIRRCATMMTNHIESLVINIPPKHVPSAAMADGANNDPDVMERLNRDGYFVVESFLSRAQCDALLEVFRAHDSPTHRGAWGASMYSEDVAYRVAIHHAIKDAFTSSTRKILPGYQLIFCNFLVKEPSSGDAGIVQIHQDPTFVDEERYDTIGLWVPLVDTDADNGALAVLPGSHRWNNGPRSYSSYPSPYRGLIPAFSKHAQTLPMKAGSALVFSQKVFHGSSMNRSNATRITASALLAPREAQVRFYQTNPSLPGKLEVFEVDAEFYIRYTYGTRLESASRIAVTDRWHEVIGPEQLQSLAARRSQ